MTTRRLTEQDIKIKAEKWDGHRPRYRVAGHVVGLSCVHHVIWDVEGRWATHEPVLRACMALELQRKLAMHVEAVRPFIVLEPYQTIG